MTQKRSKSKWGTLGWKKNIFLTTFSDLTHNRLKGSEIPCWFQKHIYQFTFWHLLSLYDITWHIMTSDVIRWHQMSGIILICYWNQLGISDCLRLFPNPNVDHFWVICPKVFWPINVIPHPILAQYLLKNVWLKYKEPLEEEKQMLKQSFKFHDSRPKYPQHKNDHRINKWQATNQEYLWLPWSDSPGEVSGSMLQLHGDFWHGVDLWWGWVCSSLMDIQLLGDQVPGGDSLWCPPWTPSWWAGLPSRSRHPYTQGSWLYPTGYDK